MKARNEEKHNSTPTSQNAHLYSFSILLPPAPPTLPPNPHHHHPKNSRDYAIACANESAMALAAARGKNVPAMGYRKPRDTDVSFHKTWFSHLQWKAWRLDRQGGGYIPRF